MAESSSRKGYVGSRVKPVEDPKLITGHGNYIDDIQLPRMAHAAFLRSPHAHAYLKAINISRARELPGVLAIRTGKELKPRVRRVGIGEGIPGIEPIPVSPLATDKVRFVGEAVAVVVATDRYVAEDALDLIDVQYEPLPPEMDPERAARGEGEPIHEALSSNIAHSNKNSVGDIEEAYDRADRVIKETFRQQMTTHVPMECRGLIAHWNPGAKSLTLRASLQFAHIERTLLADIIDLPEHKIRVIVPDVGGGFGQKSQVYPEDLTVCLLSMELGIPVKWIEDRRENLMASSHGRAHMVHVEAPITNDGIVLGLRAQFIDDIGAYPLYPWAPHTWVMLAAAHLPNHYKIKNYQWESLCVYTNKTPEAPYRSPGNAFSTWVMEGLMDIVARDLGLDPVEVRLKNIVRKADEPYETAGGATLENISSVETLEQVQRLIGYQDFRKEQEEARKRGRYLGLGIGSFTNGNAADEKSNPARHGIKGAGQEVATVRMQPSGKVQAFTSVSPHGQGLETTLAQILADELGIPMDFIEILHGDSDMPAEGAGTWGDRSAILGGGAIILAGRDLRNKLLGVASHLMEVAKDDLHIQDGYVFSKSSPAERLAVSEVTQAAFADAEDFPPGLEGGLVSTRRYDFPKRRAESNGAHMAIVEVDTETGKVKINRYIAVEDCGRVINPIIVEGQTRGCVAQGVGEVLLEEIAYDGAGQPLATTFMDYLLPQATDLPDIEMHLLDNPTPETLGGFKSAGGHGLCGSISAVSSAIADALAPFNVRVNTLPLKPDRILQMIGPAS